MGRIGLLGGECTGKSTLAADLAADPAACVADEQLRAFVVAHGRPPRPDEQRAVMLAQQSAEDAAALACPHGLVVGDPAPLMTAVYGIAYFGDRSLLDEAVGLARGYDLLAWCDVDLPWEPDPGQRDGAEHRQRVHDVIAGLVPTALAGLPVLRVSGSRQARADLVRRAWQRLGPHGPT